ncbi:PspC domain-containing protein [Streptomyces sp. NPDC005438]|uniref:PspC domain-containing protein n=1 Tax=Streptomyces sp. NPDC005438 TaxID=3156880 RepID=UPI0033AB5AE1
MSEEQRGGTDTDSPPGPGAGTPPPDTGRLTRSRDLRVAGGVCGGMGRYFDLDPVIFRIAVGVLSVTGGLGLIGYGFAWLLLPLEGEEDNEGRKLLTGRVGGNGLAAVLLALAGCGLSLASSGAGTPFAMMLAAAVGGAAVWSRRRHRAERFGAGGGEMGGATAQAVAVAPPETQAPPVPSGPSWWREPLTKEPGASTGYLWGPPDATATEANPPPPPKGSAPERERGPQRLSIGGPLCLLALAAAVVGTGTTWHDSPLGATLAVGLGSALVVLGLGLALSAFVGRVGGGTVFVVVVTSGLLAGAALIPEAVTTDVRDAHWAPTRTEQVRPRYEVGTGVAELDLTDLRAGAKETVRTRMRVGAGQVLVTVPDEMTVILDVRVGLGDLRLPQDAQRRHGFRNGPRVEHEGLRLSPQRGEKPHGVLRLDAEVSWGQVSLAREGERITPITRDERVGR